MTLIIGLSQPEGIYVSVDFRVTNMRNGRVLDDKAPKHLLIHYPPEPDGPIGVLAYTGIAVLPDGTKTGDYLRETLRGKVEVFDDSMAHLLSRLNRDIAPLGHPLIVNILVLEGSRRFMGALSNVRRATLETLDQFGYLLDELTGPFVFTNGSGAVSRQGTAQIERIERQFGIAPRTPRNYMKLLEQANRAIAAVDPMVSPHCHVVYVADPGSEHKSEAFIYDEPGREIFSYPVIHYGIDLNGVMSRLNSSSREFFAGRSETASIGTAEEFEREMRRRP